MADKKKKPYKPELNANGYPLYPQIKWPKWVYRKVLEAMLATATYGIMHLQEKAALFAIVKLIRITLYMGTDIFKSPSLVKFLAGEPYLTQNWADICEWEDYLTQIGEPYFHLDIWEQYVKGLVEYCPDTQNTGGND